MTNGKHAYLILAHNQWEILIALLKCIDDPRNDVFLHIDKSAEGFSIQEIKNAMKYSRLVFVKRFKTGWGSTTLVDCILNLLVTASAGHYDYYHLLSGVDLPLKSQDEIHNFFYSSGHKEYIGFDWDGIKNNKYFDRTKYFYFFSNFIGRRNESAPNIWEVLQDYLVAIQCKIGINRNKGRSIIYKGSSWFSITDELVTQIINYRTFIHKRYLFTRIPDELWIQSFIYERGLQDHVADSNMRFILWTQGDPSPKTLTVNDYQEMVASNMMFGRKFNWDLDREIVEMIRVRVANKLCKDDVLNESEGDFQ